MKNYDYPQSELSRSILGGLFAGIIAAASNMAFVVIYRSITHFYDYYALDITVLVFGSLLQCLVCGAMFDFFVHYLKKGTGIYRIMVIMVTLVIIAAGIFARKTLIGADIPGQFLVMVIGTQVIIGGLSAFYIPYLFNHDKIIS
jgi:hypothetical protein